MLLGVWIHVLIYVTFHFILSKTKWAPQLKKRRKDTCHFLLCSHQNKIIPKTKRKMEKEKKEIKPVNRSIARLSLSKIKVLKTIPCINTNSSSLCNPSPPPTRRSYHFPNTKIEPNLHSRQTQTQSKPKTLGTWIKFLAKA